MHLNPSKHNYSKSSYVHQIQTQGASRSELYIFLSHVLKPLASIWIGLLTNSYALQLILFYYWKLILRLYFTKRESLYQPCLLMTHPLARLSRECVCIYHQIQDSWNHYYSLKEAKHDTSLSIETNFLENVFRLSFLSRVPAELRNASH